MEKICKNCEYFEQGSSAMSRCVWGNCAKPASSIETDDKRERGSFVWADKTCSDFRQRQQARQQL
jgi:hypothetical protein